MTMMMMMVMMMMQKKQHTGASCQNRKMTAALLWSKAPGVNMCCMLLYVFSYIASQQPCTQVWCY
jgi:hypothetical protein